MSTSKPQVSDDLSRRVVRHIIDSLVEQGSIDPRGKTIEQICRELSEINKGAEWITIIDYTQDWLKRARQASKQNDLSFSIVCYATWVEHQVNKMVASFGKRRGLTNKLIENLIRHTSTAEKFMWLQLALTLKAPSESRLNRLQRLLEARNQYVHYKWKPEREDKEQHLKTIIIGAEKTVSELRSFSNSLFFHNQKQRIRSLFNQKSIKNGLKN